MASAPSRTADELSNTVKSFVDKVIDADVPDQVARTSREIASALADATGTVADRAGEAWSDSASARRDAAKAVRRASHGTAKWWDRAWRKDIQPGARDLWKRRTLALSAAGAAIPASRELVDDAAVRLGLKRREESHWGAFFLGLIVGAAVGAIVALLTTPKPGTEMREELATRAREAGEWVPIFQRDEEGNAVATDSAESTYETLTPETLTPETSTYETLTPETSPLTSAEELDEPR